MRWLAGFGILHAIHEWGLLFIPIQAGYLADAWLRVLLVVQVWLLARSFICLLMFGARLLEADHPWVCWLAGGLIAIWLAIFSIPELVTDSFDTWLYISSVAARYLLCFSGAMLSAYGLYELAHSEVVLASGRKFFQMLRLAGVSLVAYGIFAGLFVPGGSFFPSNILDQEWLQGWVGVPVEVFRSFSGLVLMISIIRALEIFEVEVDRLIESIEIEAIASAERERIGQDIHDGAMQGVYSVSLILNSMTRQVEDLPQAASRLAQAQQGVGASYPRSAALYDIAAYGDSAAFRGRGTAAVGGAAAF